MKIDVHSIIDDSLIEEIVNKKNYSFDEDIILLEKALVLASLCYSSIPLVFPFDNEYSVSIGTSVKAFQACMGIEENGKPDEQTSAMLGKLCSDSIKLRRYIRVAEENHDLLSDKKSVMAYMGILQMFNPDAAIREPENEEHYQENIKNIQKNFHLSGTPETLKQLYRSVTYIIKLLPERFFGKLHRQYPGKILEHGMKGTDTAVLQSALRYLSYKDHRICLKNITGIYDDKTCEAVRSYRKIYGLGEKDYVDFFAWNGIVNF